MYIAGTNLYVYGGWDGQKAHNVLHQLNLKTFAWSEVKVENPDDAPPEMSGCGIVAYGDNKLVLFGGYGEKKMKKKKKVKVVQKKIATSDKDTTGEQKAEVDKTENVSTDKDGDSRGVEHSSKGAAENGVDQDQVRNGTAESEATESGKELGQNGTEETIKSNGGVEGGKDGVEGAVANGADEATKKENKGEHKKIPKKVSFKKLEVATEEEVTVEVHDDGDPAKEEHGQDDQNGDKKEVEGEEHLKNGAPKPGEEVESVKEKKEEKEEEEEEEEEEETSVNYLFYKRNDSDKKGWTNEVKVFDISTGECVCVYMHAIWPNKLSYLGSSVDTFKDRTPTVATHSKMAASSELCCGDMFECSEPATTSVSGVGYGSTT